MKIKCLLFGCKFDKNYQCERCGWDGTAPILEDFSEYQNLAARWCFRVQNDVHMNQIMFMNHAADRTKWWKDNLERTLKENQLGDEDVNKQQH